ncbi:MAG: lamin tail domain-containing protein, partial [bacterium]
MRWFFFSVSILFGFTTSSSQVVLNEVYYDHAGRDEGFEFVELISVSGERILLDGYRLDFHDGASAGWVTIWEAQAGDSIIGPGALFVIGGDSIVQWCDAIVDLGLQNGPDAIRLVNRGGVVDLLGYGSLEDPAFFETRSAPDVASGLSLSRVPDGIDTDDNASDFAASEPSPGRFNIPHDDIAIRLDAGTPVRAVRYEVTSEDLRLSVINNGLRAVGAGVVVELEDSTRQGVRRIGSVAVEAGIAPGDSVEVGFAVGLERGYHVLAARAAYADDERPENNVIEIIRRVGLPPLVVSEVMSHPRPG